MDVLARLDETLRATNVLEHPFYQRWSRGQLGPEELGLYAGEYRHAVGALAEASALAAAKAGDAHRDELLRHAEEEATHIAMWEQFADAAGATRPDGSPEPMLVQTRACVEAWSAGDDLLEHLAVLYAVEAGQPEISRTKLAGLSAHYGYIQEGPATEYFTVHEVLDVEHARAVGALICELMAESSDPAEQAQGMVRAAGAAVLGNWWLLDGVEDHAHSRERCGLT